MGGGTAGGGVMHGEGAGGAVGWRVGGVGRVEEVPVNGWWLGALKKKRGLKRKDGGLNR